MAIRLSDSLTDRLLDVIAGVFNDGKVEVYSGTRPAGVDDAAGGTLLCTVKVPLVPFAIEDGAGSIAGQWWGTVLQNGTAGWFRLYDTAGTRWLDGTVTATGGGGDMTLDTTTAEIGQVVQVTALALILGAV